MAPVSAASSLLPIRIRRDELRARRQGTGRVTTKRTFSLNIFKGAGLGQFGRRTGLPLKQGVKRDAYGLDDVENFWRDSLESAPSDQPSGGPAEPPALAVHAAPPTEPNDAAPVAAHVEPPTAPHAAEPEDNPFRRANKLMRTPRPARPPAVSSRRPPRPHTHRHPVRPARLAFPLVVPARRDALADRVRSRLRRTRPPRPRAAAVARRPTRPRSC